MDPLSQLIDAEDRARLTHAIQALPELERMALRMIDVGGFSAQETAGCMGMRARKVTDALARARSMLKARLA